MDLSCACPLRAALARLAAIGCLLASLAASAELRVGIFAQNPPLSFHGANGELQGFDVDIARALCQQVRFQCVLVPLDWSGLLPGLEERRLDLVVASVAITEERRQRVAFTRPYYHAPARFVAAAGSADDVSPAALAGKRIGVRRGTTFDAYLNDNYGAGSEIIRYSTRPGALLDLVLGRLDLVLGNQISMERDFLDTPHGAGFALVGPPIADPQWLGSGNAVAVGKHSQGLRALFDRAVADIHANGTFERIRKRWLDGGVDSERNGVSAGIR